MIYFVSYMIYLAISFLIFSIFNVSILDLPASNSIALLVLANQLIMFMIMYFSYKRENDTKLIDEQVIANSYLPITQRKTLVKVSNWLFLVFVYLSSEMIGEYLPTWAYITSSILTFILVAYTLYPLIKESSYAYRALTWKQKILLPIGLYFLYLFTAGFYMNLLELLGIVLETDNTVNQEVVMLLIDRYPVRMFFSVVIGAPIMEELVFRGLCFRTLIHRNKYLAYLSSFVIFALIHLLAGFRSGVGMSELLLAFPYGLNGLIYAYAYFKTESIYSSMSVHALSNLIAFTLIVNGVA
ncbi:MAG: CPBP family intramembrane metalloprotease [Erysipelothrix sp.]|nr:CPBP family intramembrane metalloprotease [Erysipelothrix sp.]